jgi:hypothetical protein
MDCEDPLNSQVGGSHYKQYAIQPVEYAMANNLNYCQANAIKYVTRYRDKNGKEDLLKAIHNIAKEFGLQADIGEQVHPSTLRAWIKDMIRTGQQFPRELFNVYVGKRTKLSLK